MTACDQVKRKIRSRRKTLTGYRVVAHDHPTLLDAQNVGEACGIAHGISDIAEANRYIREIYLPLHNERFAKRVAEIASPQRMGAALTYARRYALFTLVGMAGEDDLDAPDIQKAAVPPAAFTSNVPDKSPTSPPTSGNGRSSRVRKAPISLILAPAQSAGLRDRLLGEVADLQSSETAVLGMKNTLTASDAKIVEDAFEKKLSEFSQSPPAEKLAQAETVGHASCPGRRADPARQHPRARLLPLRGEDMLTPGCSRPWHASSF